MSTGRVHDEANEQALLRRICGRDVTAMREFYLLYHRRLLRFLARIDPRQELAEEVVNDTMLAVWQQAAAFRGESRVSTWVLGIAYRQGLRSLRSAVRAAEHAIDPHATDTSVVLDDERGDWVAKAMTALSIEQRLTLELTYYGGYSCEEIAAIMNCPRNTVKTRMYYAREKLRDVLPRIAAPDARTSA